MDLNSLIEWLRTRHGVLVVLTLVGIVSVALYLPSIRYDFVWKDHELISENPFLAKSSIKQILSQGFYSGVTPEEGEGLITTYYRPLTTLSYWLDLKVSGGNARFFHLIQVILGALCAIIVTLIVWELLHSGVWAGLAGLLFATHPTHTEAIGFIYGRSDLLVTLFIGLGAFALLRSLRKKNWLWWLPIPFCFALGLLSKESALLFPILILVTPIFTQTRVPKWFGLLLFTIFAILGLYFALRIYLFSQVLPKPTNLGIVQWYNIFNTFGYYLKMFVWPFAHRVKIPVTTAFLKPTSYLILTLIFLLFFPLVGLRPRFRILLWGYAWSVLFLLPVCNIIPLGVQAEERLLFLPSVGLVAMVISLLSRMLVTHHQIRAVVGFILIIISGLFARDTSQRLPIWHNDRTLFSTMVKESPRVPLAYAGLAKAIQGVMPDSAIKLYNRAILLNQGYVKAHINIATLYTQIHDYRRAIHHLRLANELQPESPIIQTKLGFAFLVGAIYDSTLLDSSRTAFYRALQLNPSSSQTWAGWVISMIIGGRTEEAKKSILSFNKRDDLLTNIREWVLRITPNEGIKRGKLLIPPGKGSEKWVLLFISRLGDALMMIGDSISGREYQEKTILKRVNIHNGLQ